MYNKLICLICVVVVLGLLGSANAKDLTYTDLGPTHFWTDPENWEDPCYPGVPCGAPNNVEGAAFSIDGTTCEIPDKMNAVCAGLMLGMHGAENWLEISDGGKLTCKWIDVGLANEAGGKGHLNITGGEVTVSGNILVPNQLASCVDPEKIGYGYLNISGGEVTFQDILRGNGGTGAGGGISSVVIAPAATVTRTADIEYTDAGADHLWTNPDNWQTVTIAGTMFFGPPDNDLTSAAFNQEGTVCQITADMEPNSAECKDFMLGMYGVENQATISGGSLTCKSIDVGRADEAGGNGSLTVTDGTVTVSGDIWVPQQDANCIYEPNIGVGYLELSGGEITFRDIRIGDGGTGNGGGTGTVVITAATVTRTADIEYTDANELNHLWSDPCNWESVTIAGRTFFGPPDNDLTSAAFNQDGTICQITADMNAVCKGLMLGMYGVSNELVSDGNLACSSIDVGHANEKGGDGSLTVTGGTVTVSGLIKVPQQSDKCVDEPNIGVGYLELSGGTITCKDIHHGDRGLGAGGGIGTVVIAPEATVITDRGDVEYTDAGDGHLWDNFDNWISALGPPADSSEGAAFKNEGTICQITSGMAAVCKGFTLGMYGVENEATISGGSLTCNSIDVGRANEKGGKGHLTVTGGAVTVVQQIKVPNQAGTCIYEYNIGYGFLELLGGTITCKDIWKGNGQTGAGGGIASVVIAPEATVTTTKRGGITFTDANETDHLWTTPCNWQSALGAPNSTKESAAFKVEGTICEITDGMTALCQGFMLGMYGVYNEAEISGGTLTCTHINVGRANEAGGKGYLKVTGGEITVSGHLGVPHQFTSCIHDANIGVGHLDLFGGSISCATFTIGNHEVATELQNGGIGTMDITDGVLTVNGDVTEDIQYWIDAGWITAFGGDETPVLEYYPSSGKTVLRGRPPIGPKPYLLSPLKGDTGVQPGVVLRWQPGIYVQMDGHDLYLGSTYDDVNDANRTNHPNVVYYNLDVNSCGSLSFEFGKQYYWRVDSVNDVCEPYLWRSDVWSFTITEDFAIVDDMQLYGEELVPPLQPGSRIDYTWRDGDGWITPWEGGPAYGGNGTGSKVQLFYRTAIPPENKALQYDFDNSGSGGKAFYSEIKADIADLIIGSGWSIYGGRVLDLWFSGGAGNDTTEQMWIALEDTSWVSKVVLYDGDMNDIKTTAWKLWSIPLEEFAPVNKAKVKSIAIGFGDPTATKPGGNGTVYFDDIRVYPCRPGGLATDLNGDCVVDFEDMALFTESWLEKRLWP